MQLHLEENVFLPQEGYMPEIHFGQRLQIEENKAIDNLSNM
jgi:hypothetical protein